MSRRRAIPAEFTDASRGIRLHKALADAGVASRRACEQLVEAGRVTVNGQRITALPAWVDPDNDRIEVDGEPVARPRKTTRGDVTHVYVMVNKPKRVVSTNSDPEGRTRVIDLVDLPGRTRLFPVGRLDADSTGLILLTNDGELTNRLTHPRYGVTKHYEVSVRGKLTKDDVQRLQDGLILADRKAELMGKKKTVKRAAMEQVRILGYETDRTRGDRTTLSVTLREGQNREIRRLLARLGIKVRKLKRTAIGPVRLKGLAVGQWRMLNAAELRALRRAAGSDRSLK